MLAFQTICSVIVSDFPLCKTLLADNVSQCQLRDKNVSDAGCGKLHLSQPNHYKRDNNIPSEIASIYERLRTGHRHDG